MQSYHHQGLLLLPQSDLLEHMKLNIAAENQTEENIYIYFSVILSMLDNSVVKKFNNNITFGSHAGLILQLQNCFQKASRHQE